jgi:endogenous inhibitor of DNA gyrase (YacG/DUF329 family)
MEPERRMKRGRCPRCGKEFDYANIASHKPFPFCSARCRDVDLGNWLSGNYVIPGREGSMEIPEDESMSPEHDAT